MHYILNCDIIIIETRKRGNNDMKLLNRMLDHLEKFGEYDTPKYRYYIGTNNGCEYVKRYPVKRFGNDIKTIGKTENVRVWKGTSWAIF